MALVTLFGVALLVRALLLVQIARTPYLQVANIDSDSYQSWAIDIVNGAWLPTRTFYQSPFYAYFLAILYKLFGIGPWSPRVVQVLLGSVSPVLAYAIGTQLYSRRVGWLAGLGLALYGPVMLEEVTLNKTSLLVTTVLAAFALYLRNGRLPRPGGMAWAGLFFGITVVGVAQWLPAFLLLTVYAYLFPDQGSPVRRAGAAAAFFAGGLLTVLPVVWWNTAHGGGLVLTSGGAGLNLYTGNNERATALPASPRGLRDVPQFEEDDARRIAERALGRQGLLPAEVSRYWTHEAVAFITGHPAAYLALLGKKLTALWNAYEIPDNYQYGFMRAHFLWLLHLALTFAVVAPLALIGMTTPFWTRRDVVALYLICLGYLVTPLLFYVRGRYRLPAVPFLLIFAALAVERLRGAIQTRAWPQLAALAGGLAVAGVFVNHRYCEAAHDGLPPVCLAGDTWYDQEWLKLTEWYESKGDLDHAIAYAERARECSVPRSAGQVPYWLAALETKKVQALVAEGQRDEATAHFTRAESLYRSLIPLKYRLNATYAGLGTLYTAMGMTPKAVEALEAGLAAGGMDQPTVLRLARAYTELGRCGDAERVLGRVDRERGYTVASEETRAMLASCQPR